MTLPKPIFLTIAEDFSDNSPFKKGVKAKIDKIMSSKDCLSGIKLRVINLHKTPTWYDARWFKLNSKRGSK